MHQYQDRDQKTNIAETKQQIDVLGLAHAVPQSLGHRRQGYRQAEDLQSTHSG